MNKKIPERTTAVSPGQAIPLPANFPVSWKNPEDAKFLWSLDSHAPDPLAPLSFSVITAVLRGFQPAFAHFGLPIQFRLAHINNYLYVAIIPTAAPPAAAAKAMGATTRFAPGIARLLTGRMSVQMTRQQMERLEPLLPRFDEYWQDEIRPEINQHFAYFESCDLRGLSQAQLRAHLTESLKRAERVGELHARIAFPAMAAMSLYEELYDELFPDAAPLDALRLLPGFDNQTLAGDRQLWELSRLALEMPAVQHVITENPAEKVIPGLETFPEGRRFLVAFRAYLRQHGERLNAFGQLTEPSWFESPVTAVACLQAYVTHSEADPEAERARLVAARDQAVAEARARLAGYPSPVRTQFEMLLRAAQLAAGIKEDNHWVVERLCYQMRRLALEFGRRLVAGGILATVEDVFYLAADELLANTGDALPDLERIRQRQAEREHFRSIKPPPMLGTMPHFVPKIDSPFTQAMKKGDGAMVDVVAGREDGQTLVGQPGSGGVATGPARLILSLADAGRLQSGDVLIAPATMPPWTPLFGIAAAIVTDSGGVLSHCAIIAREYGIPAVVGTGWATKTFYDGQLLEVDGRAGTVRLVASSDP